MAAAPSQASGTLWDLPFGRNQGCAVFGLPDPVRLVPLVLTERAACTRSTYRERPRLNGSRQGTAKPMSWSTFPHLDPWEFSYGLIHQRWPARTRRRPLADQQP